MEVKKTLCDCCGADNAKKYRTLAISRIEHTEGKAIEKPYVSEIEVDLCDECAMKATNLEDTSASYFSVQLHNPKEFDIERIKKWLLCNAKKYAYMKHSYAYNCDRADIYISKMVEDMCKSVSPASKGIDVADVKKWLIDNAQNYAYMSADNLDGAEIAVSKMVEEMCKALGV